jgi:hypothetical protein
MLRLSILCVVRPTLTSPATGPVWVAVSNHRIHRVARYSQVDVEATYQDRSFLPPGGFSECSTSHSLSKQHFPNELLTREFLH